MRPQQFNCDCILFPEHDQTPDGQGGREVSYSIPYEWSSLLLPLCMQILSFRRLFSAIRDSDREESEIGSRKKRPESPTELSQLRKRQFAHSVCEWVSHDRTWTTAACSTCVMSVAKSGRRKKGRHLQPKRWQRSGIGRKR